MSQFRKREPAELDLAPETPTLLQDIIDVHRNAFGYGIDEFCDLLASNPPDLRAAFQLEQRPAEVRSKLRVIRN